VTVGEVNVVLELVNASTHEERWQALSRLSRIKRLGDTAMRFIASQMDVSRRAADQGKPLPYTLRPLANAAESCQALRPLPTPAVPMALSRDVKIVIDEWVECWNAANELRQAGASTPGPLLLYGPTGTGKTTLASWVSKNMSKRHTAAVLDAHNVVRSHLGETGSGLVKVFDACEQAQSLLVVEELDALGENRQSTEGSAAQAEQNRITVAFLRLLDDAKFPIIATTNRLGQIDPAIVRRFELLIEVAPPTKEMKTAILSNLLGCQPPDSLLDMDITHAVKLARRAKRLSVVRKGTDVRELVATLAA
jgi:SpoVK/Ycf46/Vps4 family AAA+-type ATPase